MRRMNARVSTVDFAVAHDFASGDCLTTLLQAASGSLNFARVPLGLRSAVAAARRIVGFVGG